MAKGDVVKCPLCKGSTHIEDPALREALEDLRLREQVELYISKLLESPGEVTGVGAAPQPRDFQRDVHTWNPAVPMWRRSLKE
jgi:hypothetical protein